MVPSDPLPKSSLAPRIFPLSTIVTSRDPTSQSFPLSFGYCKHSKTFDGDYIYFIDHGSVYEDSTQVLSNTFFFNATLSGKMAFTKAFSYYQLDAPLARCEVDNIHNRLAVSINTVVSR